MSTPSALSTNGRARKSLEYQLDRFDSILDGLANALSESVADVAGAGAARCRLRAGIAAIAGRVVGAVAERLRTTRTVLLIAMGVALDDRRGGGGGGAGCGRHTPVRAGCRGHRRRHRPRRAGAGRVAPAAALPGPAAAGVGP